MEAANANSLGTTAPSNGSTPTSVGPDACPHFCTQMHLPVELAEKAIQVAIQQNPNNIINSPDLAVPPAGGILPGQKGAASGGSQRLGLFVRKMWPNGITLKVRFLGFGSPFVCGKVQQYANLWMQYAGITFQWVDSGPAHIRITFNRGGSWSYLGTDALLRDEWEPTMNFGWFHDGTPDVEFSRTTLHEFGHALGCVHEHAQPKASIKWNKPVVYETLERESGWGKDQVDAQLFLQYTADHVDSSQFDAASIMEYVRALEKHSTIE
ncbi:hypothetical protein TWF694_005404 [Orbilia ellipsospora]|uniref:Peptidase metallopeptidase domain-containing protein n=1 Tax=Orbilia ellipsospora TaxID=2528407 RepID=A0AAV9WTB0_9PEZI